MFTPDPDLEEKVHLCQNKKIGKDQRNFIFLDNLGMIPICSLFNEQSNYRYIRKCKYKGDIRYKEPAYDFEFYQCLKK